MAHQQQLLLLQAPLTGPLRVSSATPQGPMSTRPSSHAPQHPVHVLEQLLADGYCSTFIGHAVNCVSSWNRRLRAAACTPQQASSASHNFSAIIHPSAIISPLEIAFEPSYILHAAYHSISHSSSQSAAVMAFLTSLLYTSTRITFPTDQPSLLRFQSIMGKDVTALDLFIVSSSTASKFLFDVKCVAALTHFWDGVSAGAGPPTRKRGWLADLERGFLKLIQWNLAVSPAELHDWTMSIIQVVMSGTVVPVMLSSSRIVVFPKRGERSQDSLLTPAELSNVTSDSTQPAMPPD
ncbi:hypothetical protein SeLEV6574_g02545 [Synchytrium endobioticum]|nr:hypothetical protein SeLEV6574_g02545 [Synchytrium endobioticum]